MQSDPHTREMLARRQGLFLLNLGEECSYEDFDLDYNICFGDLLAIEQMKICQKQKRER